MKLPEASDTRIHAWMIAVAFGVSSEVWMYRQALHFRRIDLSVVTYRHSNADQFPANGFELRLIEGRRRLPRSQRVRDLTLDWLARRNRHLKGLAMTSVETLWWLHEIATRRPDVALTHFGTTAVEVFPLLESMGIPMVAHFNGFDLSRALNSKRYRRMLRDSAHRFARCVVLADYMRDVLVDHGVPDRQIIKIPPGVSMDENTLVDGQSDADGCRFLAVGRFTAKKRPDLTVRAFARVATRDPAVNLIMIGDGPLLKKCRRLAQSLGVSDRIEFAGSQPHAVVEAEYRKASVFVQHSATASDGDREGWPVAIAEAAARGLAVVSTRHASIPEQIAHGESGLLCDECDWETMAEHLMQLAADRQMRTRMGQAARRHMTTMCVQSQVNQLEDVLLESAGTTL